MNVDSRKRKLFFIIISLTTLISSLNAKPKKELIYQKAVHPREYVFDLCDFSNQVFLGLNTYSGVFETEIDFTDYVSNDLPLRGDKLSFYFRGTSTKDAHNMYVELVIDYERMSNYTRQFASNVVKKEYFDGYVSFVLEHNIKSSLKIRLYSDMKNRPGHVDQTYFKFKRVVESTNTIKEAKEEKKALKKNIEIQEIKSEIVDDYQQIALEKGVTSANHFIDTDSLTEEERLELARLEAAKRAEEDRKREAERQAKEQELLQEQLAKIRENANSGKVNRYSKEYLSDYVLYDKEAPVEFSDYIYEPIDNPNEADSFNRTVLMKAAKAGNDWQVKALIEAGADVNLQDKDGWTALMYAVRYQEGLECVQLLIDAGAEIKVKNNYGSSALILASCYNNNPDIIKKLLVSYSPSEKETLRSFVMLLSESHTSEFVQVSKIQLFLDMAVPVNAFYEGKTPLMYAAQFSNSTNVIRVLLENNALVGIRSTEGKIAFDYAKENKNLKHDNIYWALNKKQD
ncbi:MAG: ankyrin repeat domain-containing protein [Treponema sp.]|nr:ankyrin repeat domain-containing protein [Treponema sp.]